MSSATISADPVMPGGKRIPKSAAVKNKMPAEQQITAEQLMREAKERELEVLPPPPKQKIADHEELKSYQLRKRKEFEDNIRKNRGNITHYLKYAKWEESMGEIQRARSVFERGLDVDHRTITTWLKYAEMEMKHKQINHARNIWDRAVSILPRANQFWLKYTYMEEMLGNVVGARQTFERWMKWLPEEQNWYTYINFELRYKEIENVRNIYERLIVHLIDVKHWIKYAKFEERHGYINRSRAVYERAVEFFGEVDLQESLFISFAQFEEKQKEHERARIIYKFALEKIPKEECLQLFKNYTIHEKKFGSRDSVENVIISKRKFQYESEIQSNPLNYDAWFDYLRLMEDECDSIDVIRDAYERAIASVPPLAEKRSWRRYIYLWINYAIFEELQAKNIERCREVYKTCLEIIPHKKFTFAKIWIMFAHFEIRQKEVTTARKIMGQSIGRCPKDKLFNAYIEMEQQLREFDRCRILYQKFLEFGPENCNTWKKFAELEAVLGDFDRARALYQLAVKQPVLDMPELIWKAFIDFEIEQEEYERARQLYKILLTRTKHVKVWVSLARFEVELEEVDEEEGGGAQALERARNVFKEANKVLRLEEAESEQRLMLLQHWKQFEDEKGDETAQREVNEMMPKRIKKRRKMVTDDGVDAGWEEYYDYIFPDATGSRHIQSNIRLLELAKKWSKHKGGNPKTGDDDENEDADSDLSYENDDDDSEQSDSEEDEGSSDAKKMKFPTDLESSAKVEKEQRSGISMHRSIGEALRKDDEEDDEDSSGKGSSPVSSDDDL